MQKSTPINLLSVIIPVYKQSQTIYRNLQSIIEELQVSKIPYEVIVVIDGLLDRSYFEAKKVRSRKVRVIGYPENKGKGYAVRFGMARANGDVVAFIDAGGEIRESGIPMLVAHMMWYNADIVVGSKRHPASAVVYPPLRTVLSFGYQLLVKILFNLSIRDTQVGLKIYKREVLLDVLPRMYHEKFSFDIELLAVANYLGYTRIYDSPVELDFSEFTSSITFKNVILVVVRMFYDTFDVFVRLHILKYYDRSNKRYWHNNPDLLGQ